MNTKQIVAILVVVALAGAGVIGLGYAYNTSTTNTTNNAPEAYLLVEQVAVDSGQIYTSSFDVNTFVYNTTQNAAGDITYAFGALINQTTGAEVTDDNTAYYHAAAGQSAAVINDTSDGGTPVYKLGAVKLDLKDKNLATIPTLTLKAKATAGLLFEQNAGFKYYFQVMNGSTNLGVIEFEDMTSTETLTLGAIASPGSTDLSTAVASYTINLFAVPNGTLTSAVAPLTAAAFTLQIDTDNTTPLSG